MSLKWFSEHKGATAAIFIGGAVVLYLLLRNSSASSSSSSGITSLAQTQAQEQAAEIQAGESESEEAIQAQGEQNAAQITANSQTQENQDTIAGEVLGAQLENQGTLGSEEIEDEAYQQQLQAEQETNTELLPLEETAISQVGQGGSLETSGTNELALLLGEEGAVGKTSVPAGPNTSAGIISALLGSGGIGGTLGDVGL
jgi:hypothetical protein